MSDLNNEMMPLGIDNVPGKRAAQLRHAESVSRAARLLLRTDVRQPPAVTGDEGPHSYRRSSVRATPSAGVASSRGAASADKVGRCAEGRQVCERHRQPPLSVVDTATSSLAAPFAGPWKSRNAPRRGSANLSYPSNDTR